MRRRAFLLACSAAFLFSACEGGSQLPNPTGKASVRAINAVPRSPAVSFLIEETPIGVAAYKGVFAAPSPGYDDFEYVFNFEVRFAGEDENTRIASQRVDFVADQDYTLLLTGTVASPAVTVWESSERNFDSNATVFQIRFAHTANSLGAVDYYFDAAGIAPAAGNQDATLTFGQIADPVDIESGDYVLTMTTAGNPADILYQSDTTSFLAATNVIVTPFDGDENDIAPIVVRSLGAQGSAFTLPNSDFPPTVEFLHGAMDLGASDIYDDEALSSQVAANHDYRELTTEQSIAPGNTTFRYTPAGSTATVTLDAPLTAVSGIRYRILAHGSSGSYTATNFLPNRAPVDTSAGVYLLHASNNFDFLNLYLVERGSGIDGEFPVLGQLGVAQATAPAGIAAGNWDAYVTETGETAVLAGPLPLDLQLGDIVELFVTDTDDPNVLDIRALNVP